MVPITLRETVSRIAAPILIALAIACDEPTSPNERQYQLVHASRDSAMNGESDLLLRSADGTTTRKLVALPGAEFFPEWSPDGTQVVFGRVSDADNRPWVVAADGSNPRPLLAEAGLYVVWSPDGKSIAFERGGASCREIAVARADGSEARSLGGCGWGPASWSPDGRIAFVALDGIRTVKSDGSGSTLLVPGNASWPRWSPDGSRLAYLQYVDVGMPDRVRQVVFVVNADGSGRRQLTAGVALPYDEYPSWSPDGEWVLFERGAAGATDPGGCRLYRIAAVGGAEELLVTQPKSSRCRGASWRR